MRVTTPCPECKMRNVVDVREAFILADVGTFSLAGSGLNFSARKAWLYKCSSCGAQGTGEPKDGTEQEG